VTGWTGWTACLLTAVTAVSAVAGAVQLLLGIAAPVSLLAATPFRTFLVPALLLGAVVGGSSAAAAILVWRRSRWAADVTLLAGGALAVWILAEVVLIAQFSVLQVVFGAIGVALLALAARASVETRQRWIVLVTLAEAIGYMAPATAGILGTRLGASAPSQALVVVGAGFVEGACLGAGQARAWPMPLRAGRYIALTSVAAGAVWAAVMAAMLAAGALPPVPALPALFAAGGGPVPEARAPGARGAARERRRAGARGGGSGPGPGRLRLAGSSTSRRHWRPTSCSGDAAGSRWPT